MAKSYRKHNSKKNVVDPKKRPKESIKIDGSIYWEANADKSKRYGGKKFKNKKFLTLKEAETFLHLDGGNWMNYFMQGLKGFPKLSFDWDGKNPRTLKFARSDLVTYIGILQGLKFSTKTKPINK